MGAPVGLCFGMLRRSQNAQTTTSKKRLARSTRAAISFREIDAARNEIRACAAWRDAAGGRSDRFVAEKKRSAAKRRAPSDTPIGRLSIQFKQFQSQLKTLGEGMEAMETRLIRRMDANRDEGIARLELL